MTQDSLFPELFSVGDKVQLPEPYGSRVITDICRGYHKGNEFSEAANEDVQKHKSSMKERIYDFIKGREDGATCEEIEVALALRHQSASARISELKKDGQIRISSMRRTSGGSWAAVHYAGEK